MPTITPFLWFHQGAEEAAAFYLDIFPDAEKRDELKVDGKILTVALRLLGQEVIFLNGGPAYTLDQAFSFVVRCADQAEVDHYWNILLEGGRAHACGWLTDRFGVSWQIVPQDITQLARNPAAFQAMMKMIKLDVDLLRRLADSAS